MFAKLFSRQTEPVPQPQPSPAPPKMQGNGLIRVNLKTLINLAQSATAIKLRINSPRALQSGGYVSRFKGRGMEFDEARLYQPGDDIRRIDWKVTARTSAPHTKIFREERERPIFIAVDNRPAMHFATRGVFKAVQAAKLAALIAWAAQQQGDRIGGQLFSHAQCQELKPQNGKHGVLRLLNMLVNAPDANTDTPGSTSISFDHALSRLLQHARPGSRVYLISDFRGFNAAAEQHLSKLARHCDVVLIMVYDPLEANLPAKGRYRFADAERDVLIDTGDSKRLARYHDRFSTHLHHIEQFAQKSAMHFLTCDTLCDPLSRLR